MPRLFLIKRGIVKSPFVTLQEDETNHLRVMRLKPGDIIRVADASGARYRAQIKEQTRETTLLKILEQEASPKGISLSITLGQAIPKFSQMEFVLQKATELGIERICPLQTERGFLSKEKSLTQNRWERWKRICEEAAKQCGRAKLPLLMTPQPLDSFLSLASDLRICLWEGEKKIQGIRDLFREIKRPETITLLVGPEGSFSPEEIEKIRKSGYYTLPCGQRIMRVETAALAITAICQYEWGDF